MELTCDVDWVRSGYGRDQLTVKGHTRLYLKHICYVICYVIEWSSECGCFVKQKKYPEVMRLPRHLRWFQISGLFIAKCSALE